VIGARLGLRRKLPLMLGAIGALGVAAISAVVLLANQQVFNRLLPESRALQDLEARTARQLQDYRQLVAGRPELEALAARIGALLDVLEQSGDNMLVVHRQNQQILGSTQQLEAGIDTIFPQYLAKVSRDIAVAIEPRFHDRVFGLFDRLDNSVPGTGIGLRIVRRIIESHDGKIWIDSKPDGQASCFCFTLPLAQGG